jgi:DNA-binding NarL/FixJ family response regulator
LPHIPWRHIIVKEGQTKKDSIKQEGFMHKVLIVEDDAMFRKMLKSILLSRFPSMAVNEAPEGTGAWKTISSTPPDLIFMDIRLPGESGLVLTKKIKERYPDIAIIILTNHDLPEYREVAQQIGAEYFLSKGSTRPGEIVELVESLTG